MTAVAPAGLPAELAGLLSVTLDEGQLGDLELLLSGVFAPLTGYLSAADIASVAVRGRLLDGTPWPVPVTLDVPSDSVEPDTARLLLLDPEGTPLAVLDIAEQQVIGTGPEGADRPGGRHRQAAALVRLSGPVTGYREAEHGPFRNLRRPPAEVRAELAGSPVLAYVTRGPLHSHEIGQIRYAAGQLKARVLLLPLVAGPPTW